MTAFVLDASTALGWMLDRPVPARASQARGTIFSAGATPVVPALWLSRGFKRHRHGGAARTSRRRQVATLAADIEDFLQVVEVDPILVRVSVLIETAQRTHLTVYDATYLELALRRRVPLATLDEKLREAARREGLALI